MAKEIIELDDQEIETPAADSAKESAKAQKTAHS